MRNTTLLLQVITATVLDVALNITRDLDDIRALTSALAGDLAARADSDGQAVDLMHAHAHAIVLTYSHALDLSRSELIVRTCAVPDAIGGHDVTHARALAESVARDLAGSVALARTRATELAAAIDLDMSVLSAFDFDLAQARELARVHAVELARAYALARDIPDASAAATAWGFGLAGTPAPDPALPLPGVLGLPLRWAARGTLASTMLDVLAASPASAAAGGPARSQPADAGQAFALGLAARARIDETTQLKAALGSPLSDVLRELTEAAAARPDGSADWNQVTGLGRLTERRHPDVHRASASDGGRGGRAASRLARPGQRPRHRGNRPFRPPANGRRHRHAGREAEPGRVRHRRGDHSRPRLATSIAARPLRARAAHWRATGVSFRRCPWP